ncbi:MAG: signal peptidase II [Chloroflexi bacterium]|nr:MAG: signal peptidase II [Chloroflexota bacterium]TMF20612.1 MAG: signal peptidase II [Chloroflexota bacterium]TMF44706.1 MAG: signal peptidase II [Chloroflexota bacterium]TMG14452.1 MAG: signal peptidase II [Chloroflexota bacterium]TMG16157.1 MAG: signal peptidase II [Chloroflexota bacterium]
MPRRPAIAISASGAFLVLAADQASKAWATAALPREHDVMVIPGWLWFRLISNSGATLGLLGGHNRLLIAISLAVVAAVAVIVVYGIAPGALGAAALGAIGGGAISNLADRVRLGAVVDFIRVRGWPTDFNIADAGIRIGVVAFVVALLLEWRHRRRPGTAAGSVR